MATVKARSGRGAAGAGAPATPQHAGRTSEGRGGSAAEEGAAGAGEGRWFQDVSAHTNSGELSRAEQQDSCVEAGVGESSGTVSAGANPEGVVCAIFQGLAKGSVSRQCAAAVAAAVLRTLFAGVGRDAPEARGEEHARLEAVRPVVRAALAGRPATGQQRAARNVALHHWAQDFREVPPHEYAQVQR